MTITIQQTFYEPVPTGPYAAKLVAIVEKEGEYGTYLEFTFELPPNENGEARTVLGFATPTFSNKSKLYAWTKAIRGGGKIDRNYTFNSDDLIGRKVYINVVVEEEEENCPKNKVVSLSPYVKPDSQNPSPQPTQSDDW